MDLLKQIVEWLEDRKIFSRKRKSNETRALGMLLYHAGLSYEKAGMFAGVSYEAVREWYQKGKELFEESIEKKRRKWIAVDEKEIKIKCGRPPQPEQAVRQLLSVMEFSCLLLNFQLYVIN